MRHERALGHLDDMVRVADQVARHIADLSFEAFAADPKTIDAVMMNVVALGEAASRIPAELRWRAPHIPWSEIVAPRNVIAHDYFGVRHDVLWETAKTEIPALREALVAFASRLASGGYDDGV